MEPSNPTTRPPLLLPEQPLPPYSYVSGKFPHPIRDPQGHSYGVQETPVAPPDPTRWRDCRPYLRGIDLFNYGFYWEAHESWEAAWHAAGRSGITADFFKALIKLAAAGVKAREGRPTGVKLHALRAKQLLEDVLRQVDEQSPIFMGLSLPDLIESANRLAAAPDAVLNQSNEAVVVIMPFVLRPGQA
jgi:hypothetical protein